MQATEQPEVKTKACGICGKQIEEPKHRIHEATCARNNYKCPECKEIIPKSEKEQHDLEMHTMVKCQYCNDFEAEKPFLKDHMYTCFMRPQQCAYCELTVAGDKLEEHQVFCGSKTRKCPDCQQNITLKEYDTHQITGKCQFMKEIESGKAMRELAKFQEEEAKRISKQQIEKSKQERLRKEEQYIQTQLGQMAHPSGPEQQKVTIQYPDGRQYIKKPTQPQIVPPAYPTSQVQASSPGRADDDEDQQLIARLMQEELDHIEAQKISQGASLPTSAYQGYSEPSSLSGTHRRPDQIYEEQLLGGGPGQQMSIRGQGNYGYQYSSVTGPDGVTRTQMQQYGLDPSLQQVPSQPSPLVQYPSGFDDVEDSYMHEESPMDDDAVLQKALQESMKDVSSGGNAGGLSIQGAAIRPPGQQQPQPEEDIDDEILRQIIEESKRQQ